MRTGLEVPSGDVSVTAPCAACDGPVPAGRARQYCSPACRQDAYRRRHQPARPSANLPARRSRRDGTVYTCGSCQSRYLGEQWCHDCNRPCQRLGAGGTCPSCEDVVLIEELTGDQSDDTPSKNLSLQDSPSTMKKSPRFQGKLSMSIRRPECGSNAVRPYNSGPALDHWPSHGRGLAGVRPHPAADYLGGSTHSSSRRGAEVSRRSFPSHGRHCQERQKRPRVPSSSRVGWRRAE